jgi:hypothetical protein
LRVLPVQEVASALASPTLRITTGITLPIEVWSDRPGADMVEKYRRRKAAETDRR